MMPLFLNALKENIESLSFASPWAFFLLLLIPLLIFWKGNQKQAASVSYSSLKLFGEKGNKRGAKGGIFAHALLFIALFLLVIALARPRSGKTISHTTHSGVDIMLILDVSRSMYAEDFHIGKQRVNRAAVVRDMSGKFIEQRPHDRIGIIGFADIPILVSPLTLDHQALAQSLKRVEIGLAGLRTAIGTAIASGANHLRNQEAKSRLIVLITDGNNSNPEVSPITTAKAAAALKIKIYTIGVGTRGFAPMPYYDDFGRKFYRETRVEFDEEPLKEIASLTHGVYRRATDTNSLAAIFKEIDQLEKSEVEITNYQQYKEFYLIFAILGTFFLLLLTILENTRWRRIP